jgi:DNA topoisomerase-3
MELFIAEKPSLGRAIAEHIPGTRRNGDGYIQIGNDIMVTWCVGHILELEPPEYYLPSSLKNEKGKVPWEKIPLPVIPEKWQLTPKKEMAQQLRVIQKLIKEATTIVNAGDPDREGQLLVDEVLEYSGNRKPVKRIWLAALDETNVKKALANLKDNREYANLKNAAEARQFADWMVGMNITIAYSVAGRRGGYNGVLSVGRVQTPTLSLVVRRDEEIANFKPKDYFVLRGKFNHANGAFWATWKPRDSQNGLDLEGRCIDRNVATSVANRVLKKPATVVLCETKEGKQGPPNPFSLSKLQVLASARFGMSAQEVLNACQSLYEKHKLTSYPRTDCDYLPEDQHREAPGILAAIASNNSSLSGIVKGANPSLKSKAWDDKKITAHHAIVPTTKEMSASSLSDDERRIYEIICKQYIAQFYPDRLYRDLKVEVECEGERFATGGQTTTHPGWKAVFGKESDDDAEDSKKDEPQQKLPEMKRGDAAPNTEVSVDAKKTQPPKRFTDGTLILAMTNIYQFVTDEKIKKILKQTAGIGTEATRAAIIETLLRRGFLVKKGKELWSTPNGGAFINCLPNELTDPGLTGLLEQSLSAVEEGKAPASKFLEGMANFVRRIVEKAKAANVTMPDQAESYGGSSKSRGKSSGGYKKRRS